jgi:hypothetical protein
MHHAKEPCTHHTCMCSPHDTTRDDSPDIPPTTPHTHCSTTPHTRQYPRSALRTRSQHTFVPAPVTLSTRGSSTHQDPNAAAQLVQHQHTWCTWRAPPLSPQVRCSSAHLTTQNGCKTMHAAQHPTSQHLTACAAVCAGHTGPHMVLSARHAHYVNRHALCAQADKSCSTPTTVLRDTSGTLRAVTAALTPWTQASCLWTCMLAAPHPRTSTAQELLPGCAHSAQQGWLGARAAQLAPGAPNCNSVQVTV